MNSGEREFCLRLSSDVCAVASKGSYWQGADGRAGALKRSMGRQKGIQTGRPFRLWSYSHVPIPLAYLIEQAGGLQRRHAGFHGKFIPVNSYSAWAAEPTGKRVALFSQKRCIVKRRMYQPGFAVYITLGALALIRLDANRIIDWNSFHTVFAEGFGFPDFYGSNMNAWIDCLSDLDDPDTGMTKIHIKRGETLTEIIENCREFEERCPEQFSALVECTAFVNHRSVENNQPTLVALAFCV